MILPLGYAFLPAGFAPPSEIGGSCSGVKCLTWRLYPVERAGPAPRGSADQVERHRTLLEINNALVANLTQDALFDAIAQALRRVLPFDRTAIFLHDPGRDVLRLSVLQSSLPTYYL